MANHANEVNELWEQFHLKQERANAFLEEGALACAAEQFAGITLVLMLIAGKRLAYVRGIAE